MFFPDRLWLQRTRMSRLDHVTVTWRLAGLCGASSARQHCGSRRGGRSATGQEETERERWPAGLEITGDIHRATAAGIKHIKMLFLLRIRSRYCLESQQIQGGHSNCAVERGNSIVMPVLLGSGENCTGSN